MNHGCARLLGVVTVLLCLIDAVSSVSKASADTFDTPIRKKVSDMGPSSGNLPGQHFRVRLYCWFYPNFMVKEEDDPQEKGARWTAIVPVQGAVTLPCDRSQAAGERLIQPAEWWGYFRGVKGNLVFLDAADGTDGGMPFVVYDFRTGRKIFEDSAYYSPVMGAPVRSPFDEMRVRAAPNEQTLLTYLRVVEADCDLHSEGTGCWEEVRKKLGVKDGRPPVCAAYEGISSRWVSAIAYPVEVSLFPQPSTKTTAGPVKCWPVD